MQCSQGVSLGISQTASYCVGRNGRETWRRMGLFQDSLVFCWELVAVSTHLSINYVKKVYTCFEGLKQSEVLILEPFFFLMTYCKDFGNSCCGSAG